MTGLELTLYSGVPFNNKYKDVLFVSRETRETFLNQYTIGNSFEVNRFEIINDTEAIIDVANSYNGFECNYAKVHSTLTPETTGKTTERDTFYFVNSARQIATNVVRLTLEKDVFQTDFAKWDYQKQKDAIPLIKNGRCILTNNQENYGFENIEERKTLTPLSNSNYNYSSNPLWDKTEASTKVYAIMHYIDSKGEFLAISKNTMSIYDKSTNVFPYALDTLISSIYNKDDFFIGGTSTKITVLNLYLIPQEYMTGFDTSNLQTGAYKYTLENQTTQVEYWLTSSTFGTPETKIKYIYKSINFEEYKNVSVGTYAHQIALENNGPSHTVGVRMIFSSNFQMLLIANNQIIDIAQDFEYSVFESTLGAYIANNKNGLAIKGVSNALNLLSSGIGLTAGNPAALLGFGQTVSSIAGDFAEFADMGNKPLKLQTESNLHSNLYLLNGIGIFKWAAANQNEIQKNSKYYGHKVDFLTNLELNYEKITTPFYDENNKKYFVNFDYYQFANLEIVANLPENTKRTIENMFLNGIRVWYNKSQFLNTIEKRNYVAENNS